MSSNIEVKPAYFLPKGLDYIVDPFDQFDESEFMANFLLAQPLEILADTRICEAKYAEALHEKINELCLARFKLFPIPENSRWKAFNYGFQKGVKNRLSSIIQWLGSSLTSK